MPGSIASAHPQAIRRLSLRLLFAIGGVSLLFVIVAIAFQLHAEYRRDLAEIEGRLGLIEESYVPALAASVFQLDEEQIRLQLRGILQLQDVVFVQVREQLNQETYSVSEGNAAAPADLQREFPLVYPAREPVAVGRLEVRISLAGVYARLEERLTTVIVSNFLVVLPLSLAILAILQLILNRHLTQMVQYVRDFGFDTLNEELRLPRKPRPPEREDELDQLVQAINGMRLRIREDLSLRQETQRELMLRKTLLECVLEARLEGLLITDCQDHCLFLNRLFRDMWQLPMETGTGSPVGPMFVHMAGQLDDPAALNAILAQVREDGQIVVQGEWQRRDGTIYEHDSVPVGDAAGRQYGRLWSFRDISRRRALEEQLRQSRKLETLGSLAGGIAHDFNNLLSPIMGYAELGLRRLSPEDPHHGELSLIIQAAARAAGLTRQILAFSRKQMLEVRLVDLNELVAGFSGMLRRLIGETVEIRIIPAPEPVPVMADRGQIEQVVLNLAVNGRDAMPQGGTLTIETGQVELDGEYAASHLEVRPGPYALLSVSDTGMGIDPAIRDRIFEPFFTTKEHGKGTGLGLATAFGIIKQHGGHLLVYSEPGHGATFKIYLPLAGGKVLIAEAPEQRTVHGLRGTELILVTEDDTLVRDLVRDALAAHGYRILEADGPLAALEIAAATDETIDLLLTDVILPQMNGRELYERLQGERPGLQVLFMSGYTDNVIADQGVLRQGVAFIHKPFPVVALLEKVRSVLDQGKE